MRFLKNLLIAALMPLLFISCGEDVVNNYYNGAEGVFDVSAGECDYEMITAHRSFFDPDYVSNGYDGDYSYGIKLTVKLSDPSKRGSVNRLVLSYSNYGYDFNKQELEEAYVDSVGGYVFDFISLDMIRNYSSMIFDVKFYDASNNSSKAYPLITKFSAINQLSGLNDWSGKDELEISLSAYYSLPAPGAKAETHFLNSKYEEVGVYHADIVNSKWKMADVPAEAVYFYFIVADKYTDVNRKFISARYTIKDRLPDNVEFVSDVDTPIKIEYLKDLDKVLTLSSTAKELILLNYEDNSIVWKKELTAVPSTFAYSAERNTIYLAYTNGIVDSVNPADGSGKQIFTCSYGVNYIMPAANFLILFANNSSYYYNYNLTTKQLSSPYYASSFSYARSAVYVPQTGMAYLIDDNYFYAFHVSTAGVLDQYAGTYISNSSQVFRYLNISADRAKIYVGEGDIYNAPTTQNTYFSQTGSITKFVDMTIISSANFATVVPAVNDGYTSYQSAVSVYNSSSVLQGKITGLTGTPKKVFCKDNILKIYSLQGSGRLIAQKYTVEEVINSTSGKINTKKNIYIMKKL